MKIIYSAHSFIFLLIHNQSLSPIVKEKSRSVMKNDKRLFSSISLIAKLKIFIKLSIFRENLSLFVLNF